MTHIMAGIGTHNLRVAILETDYYAMQSLNGYLAWDRRTRVTFMTISLDDYWEYMHETHPAELPDVVLMDTDHLGDADHLRTVIENTHSFTPTAMVICLAQTVSPKLVEIVAEAGARAFLLKQEVKMQIAWAIIYALDHDFLMTETVARLLKGSQNKRISHAVVLPEQREYPEMTDRIRQAIRLCVIEGMPAHLAADEMGISLHTIRGYIKEGYRILESYDQHEYPTDMTPQERAFMRFTALATDRKQS
jgi:DNA-binding NarL/FixJ family response regulator